MSQEDFYATLGVSRTSEHWLIQLKYRALMRRYHPDVGTAPDTARAQKINEAYEVLGNPETRRLYDAQQATRTPTQPKGSPQRSTTRHSKERVSASTENGFHRRDISESATFWWLIALSFTIATLLYLTH